MVGISRSEVIFHVFSDFCTQTYKPARLKEQPDLVEKMESRVAKNSEYDEVPGRLAGLQGLVGLIIAVSENLRSVEWIWPFSCIFRPKGDKTSLQDARSLSAWAGKAGGLVLWKRQLGQGISLGDFATALGPFFAAESHLDVRNR